MAKEKPLHTFVTKLGVARQVPKSRIWIEGKRLADAGFKVGEYFAKEWFKQSAGGAQSTRLELALLGPDDIIDTAPCTVSGKGSKPIIDITGATVREFFGGFDHVRCEFYNGRIVITGTRVEDTVGAARSEGALNKLARVAGKPAAKK